MDSGQEQFDKFNYYVGEIFAVLLEAFPRRTELNMVDLIGAEECERTRDHGRWTGIYKRHGEYEACGTSSTLCTRLRIGLPIMAS